MVKVRHFSGPVIERALGPEGYASFVDQYEQSRLTRGGYRPATEKDLKVLDAYKREKLTEGELSRKFGISRNRVRHSLLIASLASQQVTG